MTTENNKAVFAALIDRPATIKIDEHEIAVRGITVEDLADIVERHPEINSLLSSWGSGSGQKITAATVLKQAPTLAVDAIATACGVERDQIAGLGLPLQLKLAVKVWQLTVPDGETVEYLKNALGLTATLRTAAGKVQNQIQDNTPQTDKKPQNH